MTGLIRRDLTSAFKLVLLTSVIATASDVTKRRLVIRLRHRRLFLAAADNALVGRETSSF